MAQTRIYGSSSAGFGAANAAWIATGLADFNFTLVSLVADVQDGNDSGYVSRQVNAANHFLTYTVPDAAIPDNSSVTLAEWAIRYYDLCNGSTVLRPTIDTTQQSSSLIAQCGLPYVNVTRSQGLSQTGTLTKSQTWGFTTSAVSPVDFTTVYVSEFAIRLTFTL